LSSPTPIKRHEALVSFSRDHHNGLLLTWKVRQGLKNGVDIDRIAKYVEFRFREELEQHFKDEEEYLFSELPKENEMRQRAEKDHEAIRNLVSQISSQKNDANALTRFADELEKHIRFEERELFNEIQKIPEERLIPIATRFRDHFCQSDEDWQDQFWA